MWALIILTLSSVAFVQSFPEQGKWKLQMDQMNDLVGVKKSLFNNSYISIRLVCTPLPEEPTNVTVSWVLRKTPCWNDYLFSTEELEYIELYHKEPDKKLYSNEENHPPAYYKSEPEVVPCSQYIHLNGANLISMLISNSDVMANETQMNARNNLVGEPRSLSKRSPQQEVRDSNKDTSDPDSGVHMNHIGKDGQVATKNPLAYVPADGVYLLTLMILSSGHNFTATAEIEMGSDYGFLSAADYPLLGFYAAMCGVYVVYGLAWLIVSFMQWRELLRVQYWIGAVILLGMVEKAVFTAEYQNVNIRGFSMPGAIISAELVSCAKRTLSRMLVIIVSLGYGIVKPRLGILLHRVVAVGILYFILASIESCTRALQARNDPQKQVLMASLPLALLESAICFWIFSALVQTTRTLRLRRNLIKLSLYRHFTTTLAFAVMSSVVFMMWSIRNHQYDNCLSDWKELWVDDAYWHILFALVLLVIMILWRPTINNQRFAFSPLLDDGSEADDEEEQEELMSNLSETTKFRHTKSSFTPSPRQSRTVDDDLKWVEENIPSSLADSALPVFDSEEEILTSKFEISKMHCNVSRNIT